MSQEDADKDIFKSALRRYHQWIRNTKRTALINHITPLHDLWEHLTMELHLVADRPWTHTHAKNLWIIIDSKLDMTQSLHPASTP